ncbi:MAG TPA: class I SAM-dependent DNA methyltransferase, partial [Phycisphaerales bacterium]|nr:class I SAM-dependent DNA methyltransferase [Phycisphaerales bacterium]
EAAEKHKDKSPEAREKLLNRVAGLSFHNTSKLDFARMVGSTHLAKDLAHYIRGFSSTARQILERFKFEEHIQRLEEADRLFLVVRDFAAVDLSPQAVPPHEMGSIFEEMIRKYNEDANETAGDHFTPREVIRLMVDLLLGPDGDTLTEKGIVKTMYDPACGTGGMLSVGEEYIRQLNPDATLEVFGQDFNPESYAICGSDMLIKGHDVSHVVFGDCLLPHDPQQDGIKRGDGFPGETFDYMLANPPFGVEWKAEKDAVEKEHQSLGMAGRFGAGLPSINDGAFLFLQHMISKMKQQDKGGTRIGIVFNGSPLFTGDAGSGPSEIRRWILENDWLEAIVALPDQLFYNTGISTYIWIVSNRKGRKRAGKVQLIDGTHFYAKMRKSLGDKRNRLGDGTDGTPNHIAELTQVYDAFKHDDVRQVICEGKAETHTVSKVFKTTDFAYRKVTIERPLRLRFAINGEGIARLREATPFANLAKSQKKDKKAKEADEAAGREQQEAIIAMLRGLEGKTWMNREAFIEAVEAAAETDGVDFRKPILTAIWKSIGERDKAADICIDGDGNPEPDSELRDFEYVPYGEDVFAYFEREVKPHVPDAWVNESVRDEKDEEIGIVGYEIPFNRHFYVYQPPRPLETIAAEIKALEGDIVRMLGEVTA